MPELRRTALLMAPALVALFVGCVVLADLVWLRVAVAVVLIAAAVLWLGVVALAAFGRS